MYCPKCSHQLASQELRFCPRCGFNLDPVKACLVADGATSTSTPTRHIGMNLGLILMLTGTLLTSGIVVMADLGLAGGFLLLALTFFSILLTSRPIMLAIHKLSYSEEPRTAHISERRKEVGLGATLMFIGALLSACAAFLVPGRMGGLAFFSVLLMIFALLLFSSRRLMQAAQELLAGGEVRLIDGPRSLVTPGLPAEGSAVSKASASPGAREVPVTFPHDRGHTTGDLISPPSVTEHTTNLLAEE